jgi:AcrR family transcriptional regulator
MSEAAVQFPRERRRSRQASRAAILEAARRVDPRDGARDMSRSGVASEAGFAPAALYGYCRSKDELLLALADGTSDLNEAERLFNGRLIAALKVLSDASGLKLENRDSQCDVVLVAAAVTGLALLARSGRLEALGFSADEMIARLDARFRTA